MTARPSRTDAALALLLVVAGGVHVPIVPEHLEEAPYAGVLFIALVVACAGLAVAVLMRPSATVRAAAAAVCLLALAALLLSRTVGLPQLGGDIGAWGDPLVPPALVSESLVVMLVVLRPGALRRRDRSHT